MLRAAVNNRAERSPLFLFHVSRDSQEDMDSTEFPRIASNFRDRATDLRGSKSERVNSASRKIYNWVELIDHACKCRINIKFPVYSIERRPIRIWYFVEKAIRGAHGRFVSLVATTFQVCVRIRDLSKPICPSWRRSIEVANVEPPPSIRHELLLNCASQRQMSLHESCLFFTNNLSSSPRAEREAFGTRKGVERYYF